MIDLNIKKRLNQFVLEVVLRDEGFICVWGKNGSGKSTLLSIVSGVLKPDKGYVRVGNEDLTGVPIERRHVVLVTPESYIPQLSVKKHLIWGARARRLTFDENKISEIRQKLGIDYDGRMDSLSLGMREKVSLASALLSAPSLICVDEVFSSIDSKVTFIQAFKELAASSNMDVIYATPNEEDAQWADHEYVLESGKCYRKF
ncbi:MAG: ATP-binding cassette domain-containing protein [Nitrososphaerota archaeon]|nr:ATP-binding cassette domain-containing protein [Nitrososphaerota archaeon]